MWADLIPSRNPLLFEETKAGQGMGREWESQADGTFFQGVLVRDDGIDVGEIGGGPASRR